MRSLPAWLVHLYLKNISLQKIQHPSKEGDLQGPWFLYYNGMGSGRNSGHPGVKAAQPYGIKVLRPIPDLPHNLFLSSPGGFGTGDVQVMDVQTVVLGAPSLAWGDVEDFKQGSRKSVCFAATANMQICKSPQAVNELIPNLVQKKEKQLLPRVLQLPCDQDFSARTRKAQRGRGHPKASFLMQVWVLYMEKGLENFLEDAPLCCSTKSWRSCCSQPWSLSPRAPPASAARGDRAGSGLADPPRTLGLHWMHRFPHFPW